MLRILLDSDKGGSIPVNENKKLQRLGCSVDGEFKKQFEALALKLGKKPAVLLQEYAIKGFIEDHKNLLFMEKYGRPGTEIVL